MANRKSEGMGKCLINPKKLDELGVKKQQVGKTIFRLPPTEESFLRQLAKISKKTIRDFLDSLAEIAEKANSKGKLAPLANPPEGERMSYAISKEAKETFSRLAREHDVSRDNIVRAVLVYIAEKVKQDALTPEQKIEYANILADAGSKMLEIYYKSPKVMEAHEKLSKCGDPVCVEFAEIFTAVEQLNELNVETFIRRMQDEIN